MLAGGDRAFLHGPTVGLQSRTAHNPTIGIRGDTMATTTKNPILALTAIWNGYDTARWNFPSAVGGTLDSHKGVGQAVVVTYSFPSVLPAYSPETGFAPLDADQKAAARGVLALYEQFINVDFREVAGGNGTMVFGNSSQGDSAGYAFYPSFRYWYDDSGVVTKVAAGGRTAGDVWVNGNIDWQPTEWQPGREGWGLMLHEIGHALGLKHPFQAPSSGYLLDPAYDDESYTVMSYTSAPNMWLFQTTPGGSGYYDLLGPRTPMPLDIAALQYLYGANTRTRSGDSVYKWADAEEMLMTIWDGGGKDTINCANQTLTCWIDLREGAYSSIGLRLTEAEMRQTHGIPAEYAVDPELYDGLNNVAIAVDAVIENAIGGVRNDRITGNEVANTLDGRAGNDLLVGNAGNDRLVGGSGADTLRGGLGADRLEGGAGADCFDFDRVAESTAALARRDTIAGFTRGVDRIDLAGIDANSQLAGNQAFTFIGGRAFSGNATGQLRFADGVLYGSIDADTAAEFAVAVTGVATLTAANILL